MLFPDNLTYTRVDDQYEIEGKTWKLYANETEKAKVAIIRVGLHRPGAFIGLEVKLKDERFCFTIGSWIGNLTYGFNA